jgi:phosphoserine phosphatase RsbU/P
MLVLIADADDARARLLRGIVARWGGEALVVSSIEQARSAVAQLGARLVLCGPSLNGGGPELVSALRAGDAMGVGRVEPGRLIVLYVDPETLDTDPESVMARARTLGADDIIAGPLDAAGIGLRLDLARRMLELGDRLVEQTAQLTAAIERMSRDLEAAAAMQRTLLPPPSLKIGPLAFESLLAPSTVVAGDIFNYFRLDDRHIAFYLLDVAGHGVPSAMMSVTLSRVLTPQAMILGRRREDAVLPADQRIRAPADVVAELNRRFRFNGQVSSYFTMILGVFDTETGLLRLCQAGHPCPIVLRPGAAPLQIGGSGFPVGLWDGATFDEITVTLQPGDRLVVHSDGITEAPQAQTQALYGDARLLSLLQAAGDTPLRAVLDTVAAEALRWSGGELADDVSLLAFEVLPAGTIGPDAEDAVAG